MIRDSVDVPIAWRGGRLVTRLKKNGVASRPECHRGLTLMDHIGKAFLRAERSVWASTIHHALPSCQHGGG
eukprot:13779756-Alexandrium_andersonii.AAC.1